MRRRCHVDGGNRKERDTKIGDQAVKVPAGDAGPLSSGSLSLLIPLLRSITPSTRAQDSLQRRERGAC